MAFGFGKKKNKIEEEERVTIRTPIKITKEQYPDEDESQEETKEVVQKSERIQVVKEMPIVPVTVYKDQKTGETIRLMTIEEALTEIMNKMNSE